MTSPPEALVLCGGMGTRLRSLYTDIPKALAPVGGRPFITYMMEALCRQGIRHIHLAAGYRAAQIREWAEQQVVAGLEITVSVEPTPLGTAGGIKFALPFMGGHDTLLVFNGDSLLPHARIQDLVDARTAHPSLKAVIAVVEMTERGQYGTVEIGPDDRITAFREKADNAGGFVNGGIYCLVPDFLAAIPAGQPASIENDVFPALARKGELGAVKVPGPLLDMGTPEGLERMEKYVAGALDA